MYREFEFNSMIDFFNKLKTAATDSGWTVAFESLNSNEKEKSLYLKNPDDDTVVFFHDERSSSNREDVDQEVRINVASDYDSSKGMYTQPNQVENRYYYMPFYDNLISKAFVSVTNNRILITTRQSNLYTPLYAGKYFAYASPVQNQYPFIILGGKGSSASNPWYTTPSSLFGFRIFKAKFFDAEIENSDAIMNPYQDRGNYYKNLEKVSHVYKQKNKNIISDIEIFSKNANKKRGALGSLEGVYSTTKRNMTSELLFSVAANNYITFQSIGSDYITYAVKK